MSRKTLSEFVFSFCICYTFLGVMPTPELHTHDVAVFNLEGDTVYSYHTTKPNGLFDFKKSE
jgi:hypothetical protein